MVNENIVKFFYYSLDTISNFIHTEVQSYFHYTSPHGLKSILENQILWLSDTDYLNDEKELLYTYEIVNILFETKALKFENSIQNIFLKNLKDLFFTKRLKNSCYISSFSTDRDNLNMWNYYTKNNNSAGYNIEFRSMPITSVDDGVIKVIQGKVIYNKEVQKDILLKIFNAFIKLNKNDQFNAIPELLASIEACSIFFKHHAFKEEQEYRIALSTISGKLMSNLKTRENCGYFIPYIEKDFDKSTVASIMISPTQKKEIVKSSLRTFLDSNGYNNVKINTSDIPLRY